MIGRIIRPVCPIRPTPGLASPAHVLGPRLPALADGAPDPAARRGAEGRPRPARAARSPGGRAARAARLPLRPPARAGGVSEALRAMLDEEQLAAVEGAAGRTLILASAGSGKTRTIVATLAHAVETRHPARVGDAGHLHAARGARDGAAGGGPARASTCRRSPRAPSTRSAGASCPGTARWSASRRRSRSSTPRTRPRWPPWPATRCSRAARAARRCRSRPPSWATRPSRAESGRALEEVVLQANPRLADRLEDLRAIADGYAERKRAMGAVDYADLLALTVRLLDEQPRVRRRLSEVLPVGARGRAPRRQPGPGAHRRDDRRRGGQPGRGRRPRPGRSTRGGAPTPRWSPASPPCPARGCSRSRPTTAPRPRWWRSPRRRSRPATPSASGCGPSGRRRASARSSRTSRRCRTRPAFVVQRIADLITAGRAPGEIAVLYRAHHHSIELQLALAQAGVEFELFSGARFVESAHVKDVLAFCRLRHNPRDELAWNRALRLFDRVGAAVAARTWAEIGARARPARRGRRAAPRRARRRRAAPVRRGDRRRRRDEPPRGHRAARRPGRLVPRPPPARLPELARPRGRPRPAGRARARARRASTASSATSSWPSGSRPTRTSPGPPGGSRCRASTRRRASSGRWCSCSRWRPARSRPAGP